MRDQYAKPAPERQAIRCGWARDRRRPRVPWRHGPPAVHVARCCRGGAYRRDYWSQEVNDTLLRYLHNLQDVTPSKASRNAAALWLRKFDAVVRDNPITTKTLMAFRDSLKHYAPASANRGIAVVRAFLKHQRLCGEPLPDSELCAEALKPYKIVTSVPRFLSGSEIAALCNTPAPRPVETFLALGLLTGA